MGACGHEHGSFFVGGVRFQNCCHHAGGGPATMYDQSGVWCTLCRNGLTTYRPEPLPVLTQAEADGRAGGG